MNALGLAMGSIAALAALGLSVGALAKRMGLPALTGCLVAGFIFGAPGLSWLGPSMLESARPASDFAIHLIALSSGTELAKGEVLAGGRALAVSTALYHTVLPLALCGLMVGFAQPFFSLDLRETDGLIFCVLAGIVGASRSPAALLSVLADAKPHGPLTRFSVAQVMTSNVACLALIQIVSVFGDGPRTPFEIAAHGLENVGVGIALGALTSFGLAKRPGWAPAWVLLVVGSGQLIHRAGLDPLIALLVAGAWVRHRSPEQWVIRDATRPIAVAVYAVFFVRTGALLEGLDWGGFLLAAAAFALARAILTVGFWRAVTLVARPNEPVRSLGWSSLISQAGLTLGLAHSATESFPAIGPALGALTLGAVVINETVGPLIFRWALGRAGEVGRPDTPPPEVASLS